MTCFYRFEIPDPSRPIPEGQRGAVGPAAELMPFEPAPLDPAQAIGRTIEGASCAVGTYGMGGPGFLGLRLGGGSTEEWLVVAVWGAGAWATCEGRLVEDFHFDVAGRSPPWVGDDGNLLDEHLKGKRIESVDIGRTSMRIGISDGYDLTIAEDASTRPVLAGNGKPRAFSAEDDLRRAVFLSPTTELWTAN
jgi:hypothetical protein